MTFQPNTSVDAADHESAQMSAAPVVEPEENRKPKIAVDSADGGEQMQAGCPKLFPRLMSCLL